MELTPKLDQGSSATGDSCTEVQVSTDNREHQYGATYAPNDQSVAPISVTISPQITRQGGSGATKSSAAQSGEDLKNTLVKVGVPALAAIFAAWFASRRNQDGLS